MRPKKTILCVSTDDSTLSIRRFLLETYGFRVLGAPTAKDAIAEFYSAGVDLVLVDLDSPGMSAINLVIAMKAIRSQVAVLLTSETTRPGSIAHPADAILYRCSHTDLLARVKVMSARKRGPRKKDVQSIPLTGVIERVA